MIQTVEAVIDADGRVQLLGEVHVDGPRRALVTVLDEAAILPGGTAPPSEANRLIEHGQEYPVWSPDAAFGAADVLLKSLGERG